MCVSHAIGLSSSALRLQELGGLVEFSRHKQLMLQEEVLSYQSERRQLVAQYEAVWLKSETGARAPVKVELTLDEAREQLRGELSDALRTVAADSSLTNAVGELMGKNEALRAKLKSMADEVEQLHQMGYASDAGCAITSLPPSVARATTISSRLPLSHSLWRLGASGSVCLLMQVV